MDKNRPQHHNGFFNGFLLGVIVGALVVYLTATKKGKRILKLISEEGFENISSIIEEYSKDDEEEDKNETKKEDSENKEVLLALSDKPQKRRFFKRVK